jgi:hypothetical protein
MQKNLIDKLLQASALINADATKGSANYYVVVNSTINDIISKLRPENRIKKIKKIFNEEVFIR